jgi:transketolase
MDSAKFPDLHSEDYQFTPGNIDILGDGNDLTVFALGSVVHEAVKARVELLNNDINIGVVNVPSIRPLEHEQIIQVLQKVKKVVTVEEHSLHGGLGSIISEIVADNNLDVKVKRLGITEGTFSKSGPRPEIRSHYKIDTQGIVETVTWIMEH